MRCRECGQPRLGRSHAHGLCASCYARARRAGVYGNYPAPKGRRSFDVLEDFEFIRSTHGGGSYKRDIEIAAERMGITPGALKQRLRRRRIWEAEWNT